MEGNILLPGEHSYAEGTSQVRKHFSGNLENVSFTDEEKQLSSQAGETA